MRFTCPAVNGNASGLTCAGAISLRIGAANANIRQVPLRNRIIRILLLTMFFHILCQGTSKCRNTKLRSAQRLHRIMEER